LCWISAVDSEGRTIWIVDAHRDDGRRFVVHSDEKLSAFVELERQVLTVTFISTPLTPVRAGEQFRGPSITGAPSRVIPTVAFF
jgi:hypothetical protein